MEHQEKRIVIIEDDPFMREELQYTFQREGYEVNTIDEFSNTVELCLQCKPQLIILDINLPEKNGFAICKEIKEKYQIPILMLTSRDQLKDELQALSLGADDYLTKPCNSSRLIARAENLLKRVAIQTPLSTMIDGDGFILDVRTNTIYVGEQTCSITNQECLILEQLVIHKGDVVSKEELNLAVWNTNDYIDENAIQVNMTRLRKALSEFSLDGRIETIRGKGYRLI